MEERNQAIRAMRDKGMTLGEIARELGISRERVRQICTRKTALEAPRDEIERAIFECEGSHALKRRAYNCIMRAGTKIEYQFAGRVWRCVRTEITVDAFLRMTEADFGEITNIGKKAVVLLIEAQKRLRKCT